LMTIAWQRALYPDHIWVVASGFCRAAAACARTAPAATAHCSPGPGRAVRPMLTGLLSRASNAHQTSTEEPAWRA
jgi:hypothetical protein